MNHHKNEESPSEGSDEVNDEVGYTFKASKDHNLSSVFVGINGGDTVQERPHVLRPFYEPHNIEGKGSKILTYLNLKSQIWTRVD